jgi:hypothetical protein
VGPTTGLDDVEMRKFLKSIFFWDMTLNYSTTLKMEAIRSTETSGTTQRTTRRHIPEEDTLQNHLCENLESYEKILDPTGT